MDQKIPTFESVREQAKKDKIKLMIKAINFWFSHPLIKNLWGDK